MNASLEKTSRSDRRMTIVFVIKALDNIKGGAERVLTQVASGLAEQGHNVSIMSFEKNGGEPFYPVSDKIERIYLGIGDVSQQSSIAELFRRIAALRKKLRKVNPDVVAAFMHSSFVPTSFALAGSGIPVLASEHIVPQHYKTRKLEYYLLMLSAVFVKKITVLSQKVKEEYSKILHSKMVVMENPVAPAKNRSDFVFEKTNIKTILNVGRLTDQKDQKTLIEAFARLADQYPEWKVKIIGAGELEPELNALIRSHQLSDRIELAKPTNAIELEYLSSEIFAIPSLYESFGLVTAEAMAHGVPTIGFKSCPGTNELIIDGQNGLLVEGEDRVTAFERGLEEMIADEALRNRLGRAGPQSVKNFNVETIVQKWEDLLRDNI